VPKCSICGDESSTTLGELRRHYTTAGHPQKKNKKKKKNVPPPEPEVDAEVQLLTAATELFATSCDTDTAADERVIRYLAGRFAPQIPLGETPAEEVEA
jgi:hypothetical protein